MIASRHLVVLLALVTSASTASAQTAVDIAVKEEAGLRRTTFPVTAVVEVARGGLTDIAQARLEANATEVPAQYTPMASWPDSSIRTLAVDFNVTVGPFESQSYRLQYGAGVTRAARPTGLQVTETPEAIQVGNIRFGRRGSPLLESVKYRGEDIGAGLNGIVATDGAGRSHRLDEASTTLELLKRGPLVALLRYRGELVIDSARVPFEVDAEMPNSKSWVKLSARLTDPRSSIRDLALHVPLSFAALPLLWDASTPSNSYGVLRAATDGMALEQQATSATAVTWSVKTGAAAQLRTYESSGPATTAPIASAHLTDGKEALAIAIARGVESGASALTIGGDGHLSISRTAPTGAPEHQLVVYLHFVSAPVAVGAATSPAAILHPLVVTVGR